ncbi:hypothetical protein [Pseudohoeflea coraliihabitans]|uniref:Uncharacterized protein n=1 Tax=Pseudohoeflea coraliihabitans TaxID=2860393 RepID=A0ABS6WPN7_9HYPH|nr:hypothetical protein [Pseudohoeflea sp. DP4N28-3]MBW3097941.1 hypothetical protein [Pseudohoeflea sp. DP4N28-3]
MLTNLQIGRIAALATDVLASPLFARRQATPDQLHQYGLVFWPVQVALVAGLPALVATLCDAIAEVALSGDNVRQEICLQQALRSILPAANDELGSGHDPLGCMRHDFFAAQLQERSGLDPAHLRENWVRGGANAQLAGEMRRAFASLESGLHMIYVVDTLAPHFLAHQETLFGSCAEPGATIHPRRHQEHALHVSPNAAEFTGLVSLEMQRLETFFRLWRATADQLHHRMNLAVASDAPSQHDALRA